MELKISNKKLATILLGLGCLLAIVSIFCFFGSAIDEVVDVELVPVFTVIGPTMFAAMFGGEWTISGIPGVEPFQTDVNVSAGLTVLFVFALLALVVALIVIVGNLSKKINQNTTILLAAVMCVFVLVAVIMSFCTRSLLKLDEEIPGATVKLGSGAISYSVLGLVALLSTAGGIALYKKAA